MPFTVLAPVPKVHLDSAIEVLTSHDFVLFGSDAFRFFDETEIGSKVLIYVSHENAEPVVSFEGIYEGYERDLLRMRQLEKAGYRPSSTFGEKWGGYWKVSDIKALTDPIPLSNIQLKGGSYLKGYPRGPLRVLD